MLCSHSTNVSLHIYFMSSHANDACLNTHPQQPFLPRLSLHAPALRVGRRYIRHPPALCALRQSTPRLVTSPVVHLYIHRGGRHAEHRYVRRLTAPHAACLSADHVDRVHRGPCPCRSHLPCRVHACHHRACASSAQRKR